MCVAVTLVIGFAVLATFLLFAQIVSQQQFAKQKEILGINYEQQKQAHLRYLEALDRASKIPASSPKDDPQRMLLEALVTAAASAVTGKDSEQKGAQKILTGDTFDEILYDITSIVRIGAVLVGIFLIQIMVTFARYYFRISDHLSVAAALIILNGSKISDLQSISPLLLTTKIDFGKPPTSPTEKVFDGAFEAIKELSKKIPLH